MADVCVLYPGLYREADISKCGKYRYSLERRWSDFRIKGERSIAFVMLNPSTADGYQDDPTLRRCMAFAYRERCNSLLVVNLFAYRATKPKALLTATDPIGPDNDYVLQQATEDADVIVCAWGVNGGLLDQGNRFLSMLPSYKKAYCLGVTKTGHPRHPLYVGKNEPLIEFPVLPEPPRVTRPRARIATVVARK